MLFERIKTCKECMHAKYEGDGRFFCEAIKKPVVIYDVPSEHHKGCIVVYGTIPPMNVRRRVAQYTRDGRLVKIHSSVTEAAKALRTSPSPISGCLNGRQRTHKGFTFTYIEEE